MSAKNSDLIKYYLSSKETISNRELLYELVRIDERTGRLSLNRTKLATIGRRRFEFYVEASVQCSFGQRAMQNRTLVRLTIVDSSGNQYVPTLNMSYLWTETKSLKLGPRCLKINENELKATDDGMASSSSLSSSSNEIALVQIQIDNLIDYDLEFAELDFRIESVEPRQGPNFVLRYFKT